MKYTDVDAFVLRITLGLYHYNEQTSTNSCKNYIYFHARL